MKVLFRARADGEQVALLPYESGDPNGDWCAAYDMASKFHGLDPTKIMEVTKPVAAARVGRLKNAIKIETAEEVEVLKRWPKDADDVRKADPMGYKKFPRIERMWAHR
jgi:hypothetical protein